MKIVLSRDYTFEEKEKIKDALMELLAEWAEMQDYRAYARLGKKIEQIMFGVDFLKNSQLRKVSSYTLYRAVLMDRKLFDKVRYGWEKVFKQKNRRYSSWANSLSATKAFANQVLVPKANHNQVVLIFRKTFKDAQIVINIPHFADEFNESTIEAPSEVREVIIRNLNNDFEYEASDVLAVKYFPLKEKGWDKISKNMLIPEQFST